ILKTIVEQPDRIPLCDWVRRWNYKTQRYDQVDLLHIDCEAKIKLFSEDMDEVVNCIACNAKIRYGDGYTSKEYHNPFGLGYPVCKNCQVQERSRELKHKSINHQNSI